MRVMKYLMLFKGLVSLKNFLKIFNTKTQRRQDKEKTITIMFKKSLNLFYIYTFIY